MSELETLARKAGFSLKREELDKLEAYAALLRHYNARYNLVARSDIDHLEERHLIHCLCLSRRSFEPGSRVVDWGTGGGLPAIPLAILSPEVHFTGVDTVEKKVQALKAMARALDLGNLTAWHGRAEKFDRGHHYSVSRATAPLVTLWSWHIRNAVQRDDNPEGWPQGLVCLKGGEMGEELRALEEAYPEVRVTRRSVELPGAYYADKYIVTVEHVAG